MLALRVLLGGLGRGEQRGDALGALRVGGALGELGVAVVPRGGERALGERRERGAAAHERVAGAVELVEGGGGHGRIERALRVGEVLVAHLPRRLQGARDLGELGELCEQSVALCGERRRGAGQAVDLLRGLLHRVAERGGEVGAGVALGDEVVDVLPKLGLRALKSRVRLRERLDERRDRARVGGLERRLSAGARERAHLVMLAPEPSEGLGGVVERRRELLVALEPRRDAREGRGERLVLGRVARTLTIELGLGL